MACLFSAPDLVSSTPREAISSRVEAWKLWLHSLLLGDEVHHDLLDLHPVGGPRAVESLVVWLIEHDDGIARCPKGFDVVRGVVDVNVGFDLWLLAQETDVSIRDLVVVEPRHGVAHGGGVAPVVVEPVGDDANPHPSIRQPPQSVGASFELRERGEESQIGHGVLMQPSEFGRIEAPLGEVPRTLQRERIGIYTFVLGHDFSEGKGVVGADAIQIDTEHEVLGHGDNVAGRLDGVGNPPRWVQPGGDSCRRDSCRQPTRTVMFVSPLDRITPDVDHVVPFDLQAVVTDVLARTHFPSAKVSLDIVPEQVPTVMIELANGTRVSVPGVRR